MACFLISYTSCFLCVCLVIPKTPPFFPDILLVWLSCLTLSCPAIGQSASLLNQSQCNFHSIQKDYSTASPHVYFTNYVSTLPASVCCLLDTIQCTVESCVSQNIDHQSHVEYLGRWFEMACREVDGLETPTCT